MAFTVVKAKQWAVDNSDDLDAARHAKGEEEEFVRAFNNTMPGLSKLLWDSGSWLGTQLRDMGATEEQVTTIQMAHGQRAVAADPWRVAVDYANEFHDTGDTKEKAGPELAVKVHKEMLE